MKHYLNPMLLAFSLLLGAGGASAQSLVAQYTFQGNAQDALGNDASVHAAQLTADRFGWANNAFDFDGVQAFLQAPNSAALNSGTATVSFWVKATSFPFSGEVYLLSNGGYQDRWKISVPNHGKLVFTTHAGGACCSDMDSGTPLTIGTWTHVVMVHDGVKDIIYFNGVQVNEKNVTGALDPTNQPLGIGFDPINNGGFFDGALDEVMIFDGALSAGQVAALYAAQNTAPVVPTGLVASYSFSNNTLDATSFGNHAVATDATVVTDRFGYGASALAFNGTSSKVLAANSAQQNSGYTTISFWVKPASFPASGEVYLLSNGGYQERWKISMPDHGKPVFTTHANGACCSDMDSGTPLTIGTWTHVVMVHDGVKDIIYFNGVQVNEKNVFGTLDATTLPLGIGFDPINNSGFFDGALDDVQIYNYAFSAAEILALHGMQSNFPGTASNLVASYSLNGSGTDDSQFGNDAVLDESATSVTNRHGWASNATQGYATAANSPALNSDFATIGFWVKPNSFAPPGSEVYLLSNGGYQERWKISMPDHGKPVFTTHAGGACCSDMDSGTPLTVGTWTYVTMVHDGAKDIIYFNGVKVNEKVVTGALDKTKYPFGIGFDPINNSNQFDGALDDIQVYNVALDAATIAALYAAQSAVPTIPGNLIADYPFSGNALDATPYSNHAAVNGAQLANDRFGKVNQAYAFNGVNQSVVAANSPQQNSNFTTIGFWVKPTAFPPSGEVYLLSNGGYQERWKISMPDHGKPVFTTHAGGVCCSDMDSGTPLTLGTWTYVTMVHDGTMDIIYYNGARVNEKNVTGNLDATTKPLGIGFDPIDNNYFFNGALDEVQIYNIALSDAEIAALYAAQSLAPANPDNEAPSAPQNLNGAVSFTDITLSWQASTDNVGVTGYNVYQNGNKIATTANNSLLLTGLTPLTDFAFGVSAVDAAGNESAITYLNVTSGEDMTPDVTPPSVPGNLQASIGTNSVLLSWDASTDDRQVKGYVALLDGVFADSMSSIELSTLIGGLDAETPYTFEVYAYDAAGNNSASAELTVTTDGEINTGEPGLVAWYPFEGNANDATPYANNGVIGGNGVFQPADHPNGGAQVLKFDGDQDSVFVPNAVQLISDYTTVSFWIRVDAQNPDIAESYIIDFGHWDQRWKISLPQHLKIVWTTNGNTVQFPVFISDMDSGDGNEMVKTFWWYVTMVHDGVNDLIYVNGALVNSKPVPTKLNTTARPMILGSDALEGGRYFDGALDELKIYNKALTAGEIDLLFNTGTTGINDLVNNDLAKVVQSAFPNPAKEYLMIEHTIPSTEPLLIRIFDAQGRQIDALRYSQGALPSGYIKLQTGAYPQGKYFANFTLGSKNLGSLKFTKG